MQAQSPETSARTRATTSAAIFCGGKSARMGVDKALLVDREGRSLLERARAVLAPLAGEVVLACGPTPRYAELGLPLILDRRADGGPLGGLEAVLLHAAAERVFVLACDMPHADAATLGELLARAESQDLDACLLETPAGLEPLCAVYARACLEPVRAALDAGERRMVAFHGRTTGGRALRIATVRARAPGAARNLNTPEDWAEFQQGTP